jgi:hypothetical protein
VTDEPPNDGDHRNDADGTQPLTWEGVLEARARVDAARRAVQQMARAAVVDPSVVAALEASGDALLFVGHHKAFVEQMDREQFLLEVVQAERSHRFAELTIELLDAVGSASVANGTDATAIMAEVASEVLQHVIDLLRDILKDREPSSREVFLDVDARFSTVLSLFNSFQLWRRTLQASKTAVDAADAAAESAGETAEQSLAGEFEKIRKSERWSAEAFRALTLVQFVGVIAFAAWVAFGHGSDSTASDIWRKLTLSIPGLLLAAYLAREASQHRKAARWASVLVAQLRSIRAYSFELSEQDQARLKAEFGQHVFLQAPASELEQSEKAQAGELDIPAIMREAANLGRVRGQS